MRVLRLLMSADDTMPDPKAAAAAAAVAASAAPDDENGFDEEPRNRFVWTFISCRGLQAIELLRYAEFTQQDDNTALQELTRLRALLEGTTALSPAAPETAEAAAQRKRTAAEVGAITRQYRGGWIEALNALTAWRLEAECGYPRRVTRLTALDSWRVLPAPARPLYTPTAAALAVLQARARERVAGSQRDRLAANFMLSDIIMEASFYNAQTHRHDEYWVVLRLNDEKFPSHAAHFRLAAVSEEGRLPTLGTLVHRCFVPCGQSATASLPFATLYHPSSVAPCFTSPIALPESDIIFGEYNLPTADPASEDTTEEALYPVGTVLMYPRSVLCGKSDVHCEIGQFDTPWFIVFKPCPTSLLRGAVPVGRVVSCSPQDAGPIERDCGDEPFDAAVISCFQAHSEAGSCSTTETDTVSIILFNSFV